MTFDYKQARENMVQRQLRPWNVKNQRIQEVFGRLQRELFVEQAFQNLAYADVEIPLAAQQVTLRPAIQAHILQALDLQPEHSVLVVGTGSGLLTGYCALLARKVVSIEIQPELTKQAQQALDAVNLLKQCQLICANVFDWRPDMQFDAICLSGAVSKIPYAMLKWLHPHGQLLVIHGDGPAKTVTLVSGPRAPSPTMTPLFETNVPYLIGGEPVSRFQF